MPEKLPYEELEQKIAIREQSERAMRVYKDAIEGSADIMAAVDRNYKYLFANKAYLEYHQLNKKKIIGQYFGDVLNKEYFVNNLKPLMDKCLNGETLYFETSYHYPDKGECFFDAWYYPLKNKKGKILGVVGLARDISKRKRAEEALQESERKYRSIMESMEDAAYICSSEFQIEYMNPKMIDRLGHDATGELCHKAIYNSDEKCSWCVFEQVMQEEHVAYELAVPTNNRFYSVSNSPIYHSENNISKLTIFRDITEIKEREDEKKKLEAQLFQAQKMESVGRLAGGVAHDFNNMLGVIIGHAELAMKKSDPALPVYEDLDQILKAAQRSADLTRQLLAFARRQHASPKVLNLNDIVTEMLNMLRRLIGEDIDLVWLQGANLWLIKIDPSQINQILANLCVNSRDAIGGVGKVTIKTQNVTIDEDYCADHVGFIPGAYVVLAVSDNGRGMNKETLENLFEPFFTTKQVGEGTGLGLATVYGIVKQNHGFVNVYSELGQGATFKIYLPRTRETVEVKQEFNAKTKAKGSETVLVVEDEESILNLAKIILSQSGYNVLAARTPGEALSKAEQFEGSIHLLVTDVVMPEMNGKKLKVNIEALKPNIKVLFMSGYTANAIMHRGILESDVHFLQKPFSVYSLTNKVREVLDQVKK